MLRILYNALWYPVLPFALMASGTHGKQDRRERMGKVELARDGERPRIWIHASSVGEVEAIRSIAHGLLSEFEGARMIVTTMTATGRDAARRRIPGAEVCALAPLDCPAVVRRFLRRVRPHLLVVVETELWPNYFIEARRAGTRVAIVNGRMSKRSAARYRRARRLFGPALKAADLILTQSAEDARRYAKVGAVRDRVVVTGNTKFDLEELGDASLRPALQNFVADRTVLVAGSTGKGEEAIILDAWRRLRERFPHLLLVIAPRHPARRPEVEEMLKAASIPFVRASELESGGNPGSASVMILDTMGELRAVYRYATVAFVGGSLFAGRGGQNVGEPAAVSVPVLFGPYHENQLQMASALIAAEAGTVVRNATEVADACARLLGDESARIAAGERARVAAQKEAGGARATLHHLRRLAQA
jgi:3-deoxy-D-manno-octulosonic-acid transferase